MAKIQIAAAGKRGEPNRPDQATMAKGNIVDDAHDDDRIQCPGDLTGAKEYVADIKAQRQYGRKRTVAEQVQRAAQALCRCRAIAGSCRRSWISTKLSRAVTMGVSVAIMVKLVTVEYCSPVNWVTLLMQTPRMPMVNKAGQVLRGGSSFRRARQA